MKRYRRRKSSYRGRSKFKPRYRGARSGMMGGGLQDYGQSNRLLIAAGPPAHSWAESMLSDLANVLPTTRSRSPLVLAKVLDKLMVNSLADGGANINQAQFVAYIDALNVYAVLVAPDSFTSIRGLVNSSVMGGGGPAGVTALAPNLRTSPTVAQTRAWHDARETYRSWLAGIASAAGAPLKLAVDHMEATTIWMSITQQPLNGVANKSVANAQRFMAGATMGARVASAQSALPLIFGGDMPRLLDAGMAGLGSLL